MRWMIACGVDCIPGNSGKKALKTSGKTSFTSDDYCSRIISNRFQDSTWFASSSPFLIIAALL